MLDWGVSDSIGRAIEELESSPSGLIGSVGSFGRLDSSGCSGFSGFTDEEADGGVVKAFERVAITDGWVLFVGPAPISSTGVFSPAGMSNSKEGKFSAPGVEVAPGDDSG